MGDAHTAAARRLPGEPDDGWWALRFREPCKRRQRLAWARAAGMDPASAREVPAERVTLLRQAAGASSPAAGPGTALLRASPVFRCGGVQCFAGDRLLLTLLDAARPLRDLLAPWPGAKPHSQGGGRYRVQLPPDADPVDAAWRLAGERGVRWAEPDFVSLGPPGLLHPLAGAAGAADGSVDGPHELDLVNARAAFAPAPGPLAPVTIALLDDGVDLAHPELQRALLDGRDLVDGDDRPQAVPWNGHGTACAGLAAAPPGGRVQGVGAGCQLLPVRIAASTQRGLRWSWSVGQVAAGIRWAREQGAHVLSNSWGGCPPSPAIDDAIDEALRLGRGGLGCVVVFAAGNEGAGVAYPARRPGVLAVSATNRRDEAKTRTSSDADASWASNFGPEVSLAAPGVANLSTDAVGAAGFSGEAYVRFSGTSAAAPLVAGAAGQLLRRHPGLRGADVVRLLMATARKPSFVDWVGGRHDRYGCGVLDLGAALAAARAESAGVA